jgi:hypothetical protein
MSRVLEKSAGLFSLLPCHRLNHHLPRMVNPLENALRRTRQDTVYLVILGDDFTKLFGWELFEDEAGEGERACERVKLGA